ncbi:hypothetical protein ACFTAO_45245 [Paenibacillus rhizoplanae]
MPQINKDNRQYRDQEHDSQRRAVAEVAVHEELPVELRRYNFCIVLTSCHHHDNVKYFSA